MHEEEILKLIKSGQMNLDDMEKELKKQSMGISEEKLKEYDYILDDVIAPEKVKVSSH